MTIKTIALATAMFVGLTGAAVAETAEDCLRSTFEIAQGAQDKSPSDDQITQMEDALSKIEQLCDAKDFAAAAKERDALKAMVESL